MAATSRQATRPHVEGVGVGCPASRFTGVDSPATHTSIPDRPQRLGATANPFNALGNGLERKAEQVVLLLRLAVPRPQPGDGPPGGHPPDALEHVDEDGVGDDPRRGRRAGRWPAVWSRRRRRRAAACTARPDAPAAHREEVVVDEHAVESGGLGPDGGVQGGVRFHAERRGATTPTFMPLPPAPAPPRRRHRPESP